MPHSRKDGKPHEVSGKCVIPRPLPAAVLDQFLLKSPEYEKRRIREYVEWQATGEKVRRLEKVATERLHGRKLDAWDVQTDRERYWVITNPTNLYLQETFQSLDFTITVHVGLMERVFARRDPSVAKEEEHRLAAAWRRWIQAAEALDSADEAEEFQAVGMRCRECLLKFIHMVASDTMVPAGERPPERSNFVRWSELIAETIAPSGSAERLRAYLKSVSKSTWELVNWLTHAANAIRLDGQIAVDATQNILAAFGAALVRYERGVPDRCPSCSSYRIASDYRPDLDVDAPYVTLCEACGWIDQQQPPVTFSTEKGASSTKWART